MGPPGILLRPTLVGISAIAGYAVPRAKYFLGIAAVSLQFVSLAWGAPPGEWPLILIGGGVSFGVVALLCTFASVVMGAVREASAKRLPTAG